MKHTYEQRWLSIANAQTTCQLNARGKMQQGGMTVQDRLHVALFRSAYAQIKRLDPLSRFVQAIVLSSDDISDRPDYPRKALKWDKYHFLPELFKGRRRRRRA